MFLYDDQGWILTDPKESKMYGAADLKSDFSYFDSIQYGKDGIPSSFYSMNFYTQKNYDKIYRSYMKFQDFAAVIGGFMKIVLVIGGLFSFFFNDIIRDEIIYNMLFEYKPLNQESNIMDNLINSEISLNYLNKNKNESKLKLRKNKVNSNKYNFNNSNSSNSINNLLHSKHIFKNVYYPEQINAIRINQENKMILKNSYDYKFKNISNFNKYKKADRKSIIKITKQSKFKLSTENKKNTLSFGIWFTLKIKICRCKFIKHNADKEKLFNFLDNYLKERLDVVHYLKKLEIIDRMRTLFFNYYQSLSFEFLKTPNLSNEHEMKKFDLEINKNSEKNFNDLVDYFSFRVKNKEIDEIDEKLLYYINPEIKNLALTEDFKIILGETLP